MEEAEELCFRRMTDWEGMLASLLFMVIFHSPFPNAAGICSLANLNQTHPCSSEAERLGPVVETLALCILLLHVGWGWAEIWFLG